MITVDYYQENDFKQICELFDEWGMVSPVAIETFENSIASILNSDDNMMLIAKSDGEIVGYAQTTICYYLGFEPFMEVVQILVAERKRSSGIGALIMRHVEAEAKAKNVNIIKLHSQVQRSKAHVFYENLGYSYFKISKFYEKKLD